ncbi:hypothetical protein [Paenibacillus fonticola]|uniref:hypothetical protein n=1 Tax=Paenibacillus fonticola TaxID=379896 RepID=UPI00035F0C6C|nr:hypothetical protein [Paenibacillus fonticola]
MQDYFYVDPYNRVWGNKDIGGDMTVTSSNNTLNIESSSNIYTVTIPPGTYHTEYTLNKSELVEAIAEEFEHNQLPVEVYLGGNHKDVKYNSIVFRLSDGSEIQDINGTFFEAFFDSI